MNYLEIIHSIASYDILAYFDMYSLPLLNQIKFDNDAVNFLISQLQDVGYDNRNAMLGLATFSFFIMFYFLRILLALILMFISWLLEGEFYSKFVYEKISNNLFFNPIL